MQHPFTLRAPLPEYCQYSMNGQKGLVEPLGVFRHRVTGIILELNELLKEEAQSIVSRCHPWLIPVLGSRNIPLMTELTWFLAFPDFNFIPQYVLEFNIVGLADHVPAFVPKLKSPKSCVESLLWDVRVHNHRIVSRTMSGVDPALDAASWEKSSAEIAAGSLIGPFYDLNDFPFEVDCIRLSTRFAIWEIHGGAKEPTCRNIDERFSWWPEQFCGYAVHQ